MRYEKTIKNINVGIIFDVINNTKDLNFFELNKYLIPIKEFKERELQKFVVEVKREK